MNHNWSATKQRPHPQSVADINRQFSFVRGQDSTMWDIVWVSPQGHRSVSVSRHFLLQAPQCHCSVRKRFCRDHCCRGRSKPGCRIVGSHTRWELTTWADFQICLRRLLMSTGCKYSHNGFLDVSRSNVGLRISGWIGQLSCLTIFSTSLSVAAFFLSEWNTGTAAILPATARNFRDGSKIYATLTESNHLLIFSDMQHFVYE